MSHRLTQSEYTAHRDAHQFHQDAMRRAGRPCYCLQVFPYECDFCAGLAALRGLRATEQVAYQNTVDQQEDTP